jgi:hypothetical protein
MLAETKVKENPDDPSYAQALIEAVADYYHIHLAPGDHWLYIGYVEHADSDPDYGWTPRGPNDIYFDENGQVQHAPDNTVIITSRTLTECGTDISCIGFELAHEATHSWIEYKLENSGIPANARYNPVEEMVADNVAWKIGNPTQLVLTPQEHYEKKKQACETMFGSACSDPLSVLQTVYGIDLTDIDYLVYGGY